MRDLTHRWIQSNFSPKKLGHFWCSEIRALFVFKKGLERPTPNPSLVAWMSFKESTRRERASKPDPLIV